jgi:hypothetical protein
MMQAKRKPVVGVRAPKTDPVRLAEQKKTGGKPSKLGGKGKIGKFVPELFAKGRVYP